MQPKAAINSGVATLKDDLASIVGADHVYDDHTLLALHSEDIWRASPHLVALIVAPVSRDELVAVVRSANAAGFSIAPRGAGMSYTSAYIPANKRTISLDLRRMDKVLRVSPEDMTITVEPGCTWLALNAALAPHGLRTPFWGPMSGIYSTIGGGLSQLNAMFGAGHYGTSSESVIALTIVLADGSLLRTGARGTDGDTPFYRHYGPDLAGLFCGDSGTLGVKAEITLRLIRAPAHEDYASFSFATGADLLGAMAEMARSGVASETCAFDPGLTKVRMARAGLASDAKVLSAVVAKQKSLSKGLLAAAKIAMGGRSFMPENEYPLHIVAEGRSAAGVAHDIAASRAIAVRFNGAEIENTVAKVIRAMPFPAPNSMLGPRGEAWAPVHGHVSLSNAPKMFTEIEAMFAEMADEFAAHEVQTAYLFTSLSTNAITIEPVFYWPESYRPVHESLMDADHLAKLERIPDNAAARATVTRARQGVIAIAQRYGAAHFQIGRSYPYRDSRDPGSRAVLDAVKAVIDPAGAFNPGALGFPAK